MQLFQSIPTEVAQNDSAMAKFALFATFPIFSNQSGSRDGLEWPISPNLQLIQFFSHQSGSE